MSDEEKKAFCTEFLEKNGSIVQHTDDLVIDEEDAVVLELSKKVG